MGSTTQHNISSSGWQRRRRRLVATVALAATAALTGASCAGDEDEAATEATEAMGGGDTAPGATAAGAEATVPASGEMGDMIAGSSGDRDVSATGQPEAPTPDGSAIAIEARATVAVDDVREAVDGVTTAVTGSGGRISVADVDYDVAPQPEPEPAPDVIDGSRATLVAEVPPAELAGVLDALERIGDVSSYEQLAEDVSEQLTDLDTRIANERASIERVRALIDSAADLEDLVFLESELRTRETTLETLLADQRGVEERVAMSTLTIEITPVPVTPVDAVDGAVETPRPGIVDALADGWNVFVGAAFSILLVLAVTLPFLIVAIAVFVAALVVRRAMRRRTTSSGPSTALSAPETPVAAGVSASTSDPASRPG